MILILNLNGQIQVRFSFDYSITLFHADLFVDGNDFSYETIQKNRNLYYQQQLANQVSIQINQIILT